MKHIPRKQALSRDFKLKRSDPTDPSLSNLPHLENAKDQHRGMQSIFHCIGDLSRRRRLSLEKTSNGNGPTVKKLGTTNREGKIRSDMTSGKPISRDGFTPSHGTCLGVERRKYYKVLEWNRTMLTHGPARQKLKTTSPSAHFDSFRSL
jgi:hypothetical protein